MAKRNIFLRIGVLMLIAVLATSGVFIGSGTFAKYIAAANVEAAARVAKFQVQINQAKLTTPAFLDFQDNSGTKGIIASVFTDFHDPDGNSRIYCTGGTDTRGGTEVHVSPGTGLTRPASPGDKDRIIAPGTMGRLTVELKNLSEVSVKFYFDTATVFNSQVANADLRFLVTVDDLTVPAQLSSLLTATTVTGSTATSLTIHPGDTTVHTLTLWWEWIFENGANATAINAQDIRDTQLGISALTGTVNASATLHIKAEQVN